MMTKPIACSHGHSALLMRLNRFSSGVNVAMMLTLVFLSSSFRTKEADTPIESDIKLITLEPWHFHAALVQKKMYDGIDSVVHVYSKEGNDLKLHLGRIETFNSRAEDPTHWNE